MQGGYNQYSYLGGREEMNAHFCSASGYTNPPQSMTLKDRLTKNLNMSGLFPKVEEACAICKTNEHSTRVCPYIPLYRKALHEQSQVLNQRNNSYSSSYVETHNYGGQDSNFHWSNGYEVSPQEPQGYFPSQDQPNYEYESNSSTFYGQGFQGFDSYSNQDYAPPPSEMDQSLTPSPQESLEDTLQIFLQNQKEIFESNIVGQAIEDIRNEITDLTNSLVELQNQDNFPDQQSDDISNIINESFEQSKAMNHTKNIENILDDSAVESQLYSSDDEPQVFKANPIEVEFNDESNIEEWVPPEVGYELILPPSSPKEEVLSLTSKPPELEIIQEPYILELAISGDNKIFQSKQGSNEDKVEEVAPSFLNEFSALGDSIERYLEKREQTRTVFDPGG